MRIKIESDYDFLSRLDRRWWNGSLRMSDILREIGTSIFELTDDPAIETLGLELKRRADLAESTEINWEIDEADHGEGQ